MLMKEFILIYAMVGIFGAPMIGIGKSSLPAAVAWLIGWPAVLLKFAIKGLEEFE